MVGDAVLVEVVACGGDVVAVGVVLRGGGTGVVEVGVVVGMENRVVEGVGDWGLGVIAGRGVVVVVGRVGEGFRAVTNAVGPLRPGRGLRVLSLHRGRGTGGSRRFRRGRLSTATPGGTSDSE